MTDRPWYETFFAEDYLRIYADRLTPERTLQDVQGILGLLSLPAGSRVLDLCCGHGRHATPLAQRGYHVTGLDLSETFLRRARADALAQRVRVRWVRGDMRRLPFSLQFDAVINIFTSFGYLPSDDENQGVLQQASENLRAGGLLLLETMHREALVRDFAASEISRRQDGLLVLEERRFDLLTGRADVRVTMLRNDGRPTQYRHSVRLYTLTELAAMLRSTGLELEAYYGGLDGSPLTLDSRRLAILGRKRR